ncbi:hypothetical protein POMI540_4650 [Schizosaccharomyces pombe]|uniref:Uncharacterized protein C1A4.11c n=1 Tax=Schizosaccharomyces pombe (strain 972 / ATCC 24843) TaxID=284812 RepID=YH2B_SCHPO|nr:uncharacterized protein SPBC1A4.11c [Schizosaccharomyces pombe]O74342.1 RecName: Full=Uncharacterized protein C1A4.11c [Schizosaccharomyces pombe 972h-]CAA20113.1 sequence orphan [Schizosaccharomyces pombe]|eukprot:NP_595811.1 uncharacterized protein SPBC1A4.11c [Schizosaccharomyces pombe]
MPEKDWIGEFGPSKFKSPIDKLNQLLPESNDPSILYETSQHLLSEFDKTLNDSLRVLNQQINQVSEVLPRLPTMISALDRESKRLFESCEKMDPEPSALMPLQELEKIRSNIQLTISQIDNLTP